MTTLTITLYLEDETGKDSYELAKEIHSKVYNSGSKADPTMTIGKDYIVLDLHASKCPKKAPQSVLKAVSDSLDRVYSEGSKQAINEKSRGVASLLSVARCSNGKTYGETYGFPNDDEDKNAIFNEMRKMYGLPELDLSKLKLFPDIC